MLYWNARKHNHANAIKQYSHSDNYNPFLHIYSHKCHAYEQGQIHLAYITNNCAHLNLALHIWQ